MLCYTKKQNMVNLEMGDTVGIIGVLTTILGTVFALLKYLFTTLSAENRQYRDAMKKDYDNLQKKFDKMLVDYFELKTNFSEIRLENDKLHREVSRLTDEVKKLTTINGELKEKEAFYTEEIGRIKQKVEEKEAQIQTLKDQIIKKSAIM